MRTKKNSGIIISILISLIIGIAIGCFLFNRFSGNLPFFNSNNKIETILNIIEKDYVDSVEINDLTEKAINNLIQELDPHSYYIPKEDFQSINEGIFGHFGGIGVSYFSHHDTIVVIHVTHGGPASKAGLLSGDRIIYVNDSLFVGKQITPEKITETLRGIKGTSLQLGIKRKLSDDILNYTLIREEIQNTTIPISYEIEKGIGYIKIYDSFTQTTYNEFINAITKLTNQGCASFIIDLRGNGGGSLEAAINIINEFLPAGKRIVYTEGKTFPRKEFVSNGSGTLPENQIVILIDQISASASEVIAGAIQDYDRGLIIGRRSFGKGLVQTQFELKDKSAILLTIARYYTPSGRNIQRKYELGQSQKYGDDWINQLNSGESFHVDSIKIDSTAVFKTTQGRVVYGEGGIIPDIFVPLDTTYVTSYFLNLERKNIIDKFAFRYFDENMQLVQEYDNYQSFFEYLETQPILYELTVFAEEQGIRRRSSLINKSSEEILKNTYACILNNYFGLEAFYYTLTQNDTEIQIAIKAIQKGYAEPQAIAKERYKGFR